MDSPCLYRERHRGQFRRLPQPRTPLTDHLETLGNGHVRDIDPRERPEKFLLTQAVPPLAYNHAGVKTVAQLGVAFSSSGYTPRSR